MATMNVARQRSFAEFDMFLRNPEKYIARVDYTFAMTADYLNKVLKYLRDYLHRVEELCATNLRLRHAFRVAVRKLLRIVLKVLEYIDIAEGLLGMASEHREATIRQEIMSHIHGGEKFLEIDNLESRSFFPKLEEFLVELNWRISTLDGMRDVTEKLCKELMNECNEYLELTEAKQNQAGVWKSMLGTAAFVLAVGGFGAATGGLGFIAFGAASVATTAAVSAGAASVSAAGIGGAYKAYTKSVEFSDLESDFRKEKEKFDKLLTDTNSLQLAANMVEVPHSDSVKTEAKCCKLGLLPDSLERLFKKLRSVDFERARKGFECIKMEVRPIHDD